MTEEVTSVKVTAAKDNSVTPSVRSNSVARATLTTFTV